MVAPLAWIFRPWRESILRPWIRLLRRTTFGLFCGPGGARFEIEPRIPCEGGHLLVVNHQSLLDIPVVFATVPDGYPRTVTRARYGRNVPLISILLKVYRHPLVTGGARSVGHTEMLAEFARASNHPVAIFPEGHRTRDGEMLPWKTAGLRAMLESRRWRVHAIVIDGLWQSLSIAEFVRRISSVRCRTVLAGEHDFDPAHDDAEALIARLREEMCATLARIRDRGEEPSGAGPVLSQGV